MQIKIMSKYNLRRFNIGIIIQADVDQGFDKVEKSLFYDTSIDFLIKRLKNILMHNQLF